jgi:hypothetical protein
MTHTDRRRPHGGDGARGDHSGGSDQAQVIALVDLGGEIAMVPLFDVPEDAPADVQEGLARRNLTNMGRPCPCGAQLVLPNRAARRAAVRARRVLHVDIVHEDDCPAADENVLAALRRWRPA